ncbi:MAG: hypothetical protein WBA66_04935 [Xanthobacteraceae bacterium]
MEIDENLQRAELSPAEEAMHIARRKVVWEGLQRQQSSEESGRFSPTLPKPKTGRGNKQFANEVASVVGGGRNAESVKRDVNLKIRRAEELGSDLAKIAGTSLDKGVEMDALIKMREGDPRPLAISCRFLVGLSR